MIGWSFFMTSVTVWAAACKHSIRTCTHSLYEHTVKHQDGSECIKLLLVNGTCFSITQLCQWMSILHLTFLLLFSSFQLGKKQCMQLIKTQSASIRNHFWHCCNTCSGDVTKLKVRSWICEFGKGFFKKKVFGLHTWVRRLIGFL